MKRMKRSTGVLLACYLALSFLSLSWFAGYFHVVLEYRLNKLPGASIRDDFTGRHAVEVDRVDGAFQVVPYKGPPKPNRYDYWYLRVYWGELRV